MGWMYRNYYFLPQKNCPNISLKIFSFFKLPVKILLRRKKGMRMMHCAKCDMDDLKHSKSIRKKIAFWFPYKKILIAVCDHFCRNTLWSAGGPPWPFHLGHEQERQAAFKATGNRYWEITQHRSTISRVRFTT